MPAVLLVLLSAYVEVRYRVRCRRVCSYAQHRKMRIVFVCLDLAVQWVDDNLSVPVVAAVVAMLLMQ